MTERDENEIFAERAKRLFDDSVDRLDAGTLSRLNRGRHAALAAGDSRVRLAHWLPVTGAVAAAVVAAIILRGPGSIDGVVEPMTATDLEMLLDEESLEMFEELEFYSWLEDTDLEANGNVG